MPFRVVYILDDTTLSGGSKVVFEHARMLNKLALFRVYVLAPSGYPRWIHFPVPFISRKAEETDLSEFDLIVTTFYSQSFLYERWREKSFLHFCQGFEGDYTKDLGLEHLNGAIESFYKLPYPKMAVTKFLTKKLRTLTNAPVFFVGQAVDKLLFKPVYDEVKNSVLIVGQSEYPFKGVKRSLAVASELKNLLPYIKVVRVSPSDTRDEEMREFQIDEFWIGVPPYQMPKLYSKAIISIYLPYKEGFGLPVLESIASGVPVVASDIPSIKEICGPKYPLCTSHKDALQLSIRILTDKNFYRRLVSIGIERSRRFSTHKLLFRLGTILLRTLAWRM